MAPHRAAALGSGLFTPSSVLARTWSGLSASSPAGAASVNEFSRFVALVLASSSPLDAPTISGSGGPLPSPGQAQNRLGICRLT